jgi:hypothetical protein
LRISRPHARHSRNITARAAVSTVIFDSAVPETQADAQLIGSCAPIRSLGAQVVRICCCVRLGPLVNRVGAITFAVVARLVYQTL